MTCKNSGGLTGSSGSNRKFKAPYTLIRNGSCRKSSHRSSSGGLRFFCQCLCYLATVVISLMTVAAIFWLHIQLKMQQQDFNSQINKGESTFPGLAFKKLLTVIQGSLTVGDGSVLLTSLYLLLQISSFLH